jgi:hypothetical protein
MANYQTNVPGLNATNNRIDMLRADFEGLKNLDKVISSVLHRLALQENVKQQVSMAHTGTISRASFDGWFAEVVRQELGKVLAVQRANAVKKARTQAKAGSASSAVLRRMYKDELAGNINIASPRGRISSRRRLYEPGQKRPRHVGARTRQINEYFGPDRGFILRFLEFGTDVRTAKPFGPTGRGSTASWGTRGNIEPRSFFHTMKSDMEQAAQQLGQTLTGYVEKWIETAFKE